MKLTLKEFQDKFLPALQKEHKDPAALKSAITEFLKDSEIVDADGKAVEIETLVTKEDKPAEITAEAIQKEIGEIVEKTVQKELAKAVKTVNDKTKALKIEVGDSNGGDEHPFKSAANFYYDVQQAAKGRTSDSLAKWDKATKELIVKAPSGMSVNVPAEGGFLLPPQYATTIWDGLSKEPANLMAQTDQYTVTGESLTLLANGETSRATGSRWGGVRGYWLAEADQMTASKPKFRRIKLEPKKLGVFVYVTDELLEGSAVSLEQYVNRAAISEINFLSNDALVNGTGAGQPLGILNAACTVSVAKEAGQLAATVLTQNIVKMWARLHPNSRANATWLVNQEVEQQLQQMTVGIGAGGALVYMPPGGLSQAPYGNLFGRPVVPVEYCAALGTVGDIVLADLRGMATAVRGSIQSAMSIHIRFDYNETAFRFVYMVDGQPWLASALTPYKATSGATLSTFVTLATRA